MKKPPQQPPLDYRVRDIANNPNLGLSQFQSNVLLEAAEELVRVRQLPELEWAAAVSSITTRLAILARGNEAKLAQEILAILDRGATYVARVVHRRDLLKAALEESHALIVNFVSVSEPDTLEYLSEYRLVIEQAERALEGDGDE
jgi:hypothetical protein